MLFRLLEERAHLRKERLLQLAIHGSETERKRIMKTLSLLTPQSAPSAPPPTSAPLPSDLAARLLLDPADTLPQLDPGGALHQAAEALIAQGGPKAEHFLRVRDWARRRAAIAPR